MAYVFVDRILECEPGARVVAIKALAFNEELFKDHFPGMPVLPGAMILEGFVQAAQHLAGRREAVEAHRLDLVEGPLVVPALARGEAVTRRLHEPQYCECRQGGNGTGPNGHGSSQFSTAIIGQFRRHFCAFHLVVGVTAPKKAHRQIRQTLPCVR